MRPSAAARKKKRRDGARLVRYDRDQDELLIVLNSGNNKASIQRAQIPGLEEATPEQLADVVLSPMTTSITFPQLDADYAVQGLIRRVFGLNEQQRTAGAATSAAKKVASAENGKRGGRPTKIAAEKHERAPAETIPQQHRRKPKTTATA